jgi:hypothetical protein
MRLKRRRSLSVDAPAAESAPPPVFNVGSRGLGQSSGLSEGHRLQQLLTSLALDDR